MKTEQQFRDEARRLASHGAYRESALAHAQADKVARARRPDDLTVKLLNMRQLHNGRPTC